MKAIAVYAFVAVGMFLLREIDAQDHVPGPIENVGLERIVPDRIIFEHSVDGEVVPNLNNWEPYTSVLGNSTFLIQANKFAIDPQDPLAEKQSFGLVFQPVSGSPPILGECFFTDSGMPYAGPINNSRQTGNPGRVAGDKRLGATALITGGESSIQEYEEFHSDGRWERGSFTYIEGARFATVQTFSFAEATGTQEAACKALDAILGRLETGHTSQQQISRFGGGLAGLSDGNFVVVTEDRSLLIDESASKCATAVIVGPDGAVVKESFTIATGAIWSNLTAYRRGFCVRHSGILYFHDNDGVLLRERDQEDTELTYHDTETPVVFERERGDSTRIGSHINSPYVFLVGPVDAHDAEGNVVPEVDDVYLAVYDSRDGRLVGGRRVNELSARYRGTEEVDLRTRVERVCVAADALDRVCVAWEVNLDEEASTQIVVRVLAFDSEQGTLSPVTSTFFPFMNSSTAEAEEKVLTYRASVSMTTREICIAAKGTVNRANRPQDGPDTPPQTNVYTVFSHPEPMDDPTPTADTIEPQVGPFMRGDVDGQGDLNLTDGLYLFNYLFLEGPEPACLAAANTDGTEAPSLTSGVYLLNFLFLSGPAPPLPYPACARSSEPADVELGCEDAECP